MTRPANGKPSWLIERMKEQPSEGVPEFLDAYLRMKYGAADIARIKDGYECKRQPALWVNESLCGIEEAKAALAEAGVECEACGWRPDTLIVPEAAMESLAGGDLLVTGKVRAIEGPVALLAADVAAQAVLDMAAQREAAAQTDEDAPEGPSTGARDAGAEGTAPDMASDPAEAADTQVSVLPAEEAATANEPADAQDGEVDTAGKGVVRVAELCAGTGGMTLPLSAAVGKAANILACEVSGMEYDQLVAALEAAGADNVDPQRYDSRRFRGENHSFDVILLDPPCTPTGTLHAHDPRLHATFPEAKIPECMSLAKSLFLLSLSMMEVGSVLVYTTGSVLHLENEEVLRTCLARSGSMGTFEAEPIELPAGANLQQLPTSIEGTVLTCPDETSPGRFIAKIRRTA